MNQAQSSIINVEHLSENLWLFSILLTLADNGGLRMLYIGTSKEHLQDKLALNAVILENMLNLLVLHNFIVEHQQKFYLSLELSNKITQIGLEKFISYLRIPYAQANAFMSDVENKQLKHGWFYTNEKPLQAQGAISEIVATDLFTTSDIHAQLLKPDAIFADIGAGVGRISLKFCELYPNLNVVALEPADVPYRLAKQNVEQSKFANRIDLRQVYGQDLQEHSKFNVVWLAQGFLIDNQIHSTTVQNIYRSLKPGGMLLSVTMERNSLPRLQQFVHSIYLTERKVDELFDLFKQVGFKDVQKLPESKEGLIPLIAIK